MALLAARDGSFYVTIIYPFTLLRIDPKDLKQAAAPAPPAPKKVAAVVTTFYHNSHADVIVGRLLKTDTLDGKGRKPSIELASLHTEQVHEKRPDVGRAPAEAAGVRISPSVEDALTLGTGSLAVDGVLLVAEHGDYPRSATGQIQYPKRRLFERIAEVFRKSGRSVPVFCDKHLADTWEDAKWFHDTARELRIPLMAGSSLPTLWRYPAADPPRGAELEEVVAVSYHTLDAYGFHALEMLQAIVERRKGGETGIRAVQCLEGEAVGKEGLFDPKLLDAALSRRTSGGPVRNAKNPVLFRIEYADGLKASVLTAPGPVNEWTIAWRTRSGAEQSTLFWTQEERPFMHFAWLLNGIERMMLTGKPSWPAERTLLTSGALDRLLVSKRDGGKRLETPELVFPYASDWDWREPPAPK
jgi:hypothetical protein